jgi:hypothetical protein
MGLHERLQRLALCACFQQNTQPLAPIVKTKPLFGQWSLWRVPACDEPGPLAAQNDDFSSSVCFFVMTDEIDLLFAFAFFLTCFSSDGFDLAGVASTRWNVVAEEERLCRARDLSFSFATNL